MSALNDAIAAIGPLGMWELDETSGTVATASIGSLDGTYVSGPTLAQSPLVVDSGYSATCSWPAGQDITLPFSNSLTTEPGWFLVWFKYGGSFNSFNNIVLRDHTGPISEGYLLDLTATNAVVRVDGSNRTISSVTSASLLDGARHMFLFALNYPNVEVFIDGASVYTGTTATHFWTTVVSPFHLGRYGTLSQWNSYTYDKFALGSSVVTSLQVQSIWDTGNGVTGIIRNLVINPSAEQYFDRAWSASNGTVETGVDWEA